MKRSLILGAAQGAGILGVIALGIMIAYAADILTVDKDGIVRLRVSDQGKVTLNTSDAAEGDLRFTPRSSGPTAPLAGDFWYNSADKEVKYADGGITKPIASMTIGDLTLYVNGTTGDDNNNNGLASGTAVKTIQKAINLVPPVVNHAVTINVAAGTYRDLGATIGSTTANVSLADKVVTESGSITFQGSTTFAGASGYRVTGSDSGAETTPVKSMGFYVRRVTNVYIRGFQCNYFTQYGIYYGTRADGSPTNCICDNNKRAGIIYISYSVGSPSSCQANNNGTGAGAAWPMVGISYLYSSTGSPSSCTTNSNGASGIQYEDSAIGWPSSCTANSNYYSGLTVTVKSTCSPSNCNFSLNGTSGWGYGIYYGTNSVGLPTNCTSPSGNNVSGGLRGEYGARVDYTVPMPNANNATGSASSEVY